MNHSPLYNAAFSAWILALTWGLAYLWAWLTTG